MFAKKIKRMLATFAIAMLAVFGLAACGDEIAPVDDQETVEVETDGVETDGVETDGAESNGAESDNDADLDTNSDVTTVPDGVPANFPMIGVPFYQPMELVAVPSDDDDMFVLEFVTDDDEAVVLQFFTEHITPDNGWDNVSTEDSDDRTVIHGDAQGYHLVVAVGPEIMDPAQTSIYYTLSRN